MCEVTKTKTRKTKTYSRSSLSSKAYFLIRERILRCHCVPRAPRSSFYFSCFVVVHPDSGYPKLNRGPFCSGDNFFLHRSPAGLSSDRAVSLVPSPSPSLDHRLPSSDPHYQRFESYIEEVPVPEYRWAAEAAYEAFRDMKYGIRIHWGLYSVAGFTSESWPYLDLSYEERARYDQLYKTWNPTGFDADEWTSLFVESGLRMFAFTTNTMKASPCSIHAHA